MKVLFQVLLSVSLGMAVSCSQSTEKYAQKEHGKKFGTWEMNYLASDYDVYWPSLKLTDDVTGSLCEVKVNRNLWSGAIISRDTTQSAAMMGIKIVSVKSKNDAKHYNSVRFQVSKSDNKFRPGLEHKFVFNEGQSDSLSFTAMSNDNDFFVPERMVSAQIVSLLSEKKPINLKVSYEGTSYKGVYNFNLEGSSELKQALKLNEERKVFAEKEFDKADAESEKAFMEMFK